MFTISKTLIMKKLLLLSITICSILTTKNSQAQTQVTFYTSKGKFVVEMYETQRPITTKNFINLVKKKFYDKIIFHRVIDGFMIQGGDPTGTGSGGSGVKIPDELTPKVSNVQKTIAMANTGKPNTADSQFYINLVDNSSNLDAAYTAFGGVIYNFPVVQAIGKVKTNGGTTNKPLVDVVMDSVRITPPIITDIAEKGSFMKELIVFPNPVTSESAVWLESTAETTVRMSVYNQQGQQMAEQQKKLINGTNTISITEIFGTGFPPGVYYLMVTDGTFISREKILIME
jgi:cyclophilin family peptidyl-prolyl cis-trans isomerase